MDELELLVAILVGIYKLVRLLVRGVVRMVTGSLRLLARTQRAEPSRPAPARIARVPAPITRVPARITRAPAAPPPVAGPAPQPPSRPEAPTAPRPPARADEAALWRDAIVLSALLEPRGLLKR
jgi:hypothetical protein